MERIIIFDNLFYKIIELFYEGEIFFYFQMMSMNENKNDSSCILQNVIETQIVTSNSDIV